MDNKEKNSGKKIVGGIMVAVGCILFIAVIIKGFIIGYYGSDLVWMFPTLLVGFIIAYIGAKLITGKKSDNKG